MTNDEAIYTLKNTAFLGWSEQAEKVSEAVQMAVEALKAQLTEKDTTSDCISRQAVRFIETNSDSYPEEWNDDYEKGFTDALNKVIALPSVQPVDKDINVSCKDAISKQGAIDHFKSIVAATSMWNKYNEGFVDGLNFAVEHLKTMPSVQPTYTDAEVQKMQDMHQAEVEKAFELGMEDAKPEIMPDGTLHITVNADVANIDRILLSQEGTHYGDLYYKDDEKPEIIRCKDCKYNVSRNHKCLQPDSFFLVTEDDFYCGYAERRYDEQPN